MSQEQKLIYSYPQIHEMICKKADAIKKFKPDYLVAIGGGGLVPARILRTYVDRPILVLTVNYYDDNDKIQNTPVIHQWINKDLSKKKILIVDEIDDSGTTMKFCLQKLREINGCEDIGIFVLHNKQKPKQYDQSEVTYFACETIGTEWVYYPWENA